MPTSTQEIHGQETAEAPKVATAYFLHMEPADVSDHQLMLAVREGDLARLGDLFERHHRPLYGFFVKMTGQRTASEDLVQLVFYRILKYRHTYRDEGKFATWMYHMARKVAADHFRKHRHPTVSIDDEESGNELPDRGPLADETAAKQDDLRLMRAALRQLPPDQRELISLHRFQQLSHEELASVYRCSVGAVKVRVHRAVNMLRERFFKLQGTRSEAKRPDATSNN